MTRAQVRGIMQFTLLFIALSTLLAGYWWISGLLLIALWAIADDIP